MLDQLAISFMMFHFCKGGTAGNTVGLHCDCGVQKIKNDESEVCRYAQKLTFSCCILCSFEVGSDICCVVGGGGGGIN